MALFLPALAQPRVCSATRRLGGGEPGRSAPEAASLPGRAEPRPGSPPRLPPAAPSPRVCDSPSPRHYLVRDSGSLPRELRCKKRIFASARLNLIYDERALSLRGADAFPPPPAAITGRPPRCLRRGPRRAGPPSHSRRLTHTLQPGVGAAPPSPAAARGLRAGSPAGRVPAGSPRSARAGDSPAAPTSSCAPLRAVFQEGMRAPGQGPCRPGTGTHVRSRTACGPVMQSKAALSRRGGPGKGKPSLSPGKIIK